MSFLDRSLVEAGSSARVGTWNLVVLRITYNKSCRFYAAPEGSQNYQHNKLCWELLPVYKGITADLSLRLFDGFVLWQCVTLIRIWIY